MNTFRITLLAGLAGVLIACVASSAAPPVRSGSGPLRSGASSQGRSLGNGPLLQRWRSETAHLALPRPTFGGFATQSAMSQYDRRYLRVVNATGEPLLVCLQYHTVTKDGSWKWFPEKEGDAVAYILDANQSSDLQHDDWPVSADKVRLWARSKSGEEFNDFKTAVLPLIDEADGVYLAAEGETFTFTFQGAASK
jgi:hypothetical protein